VIVKAGKLLATAPSVSLNAVALAALIWVLNILKMPWGMGFE